MKQSRVDLFKGSYAVLRNPSGHRDVDYGNAAEALEAVAFASLLVRILNGSKNVARGCNELQASQHATRNGAIAADTVDLALVPLHIV